MSYATYKIRLPQGDTPENLIKEQGGAITNLLISPSFEVLAEVSGDFNSTAFYPWSFRKVSVDEALGFAVVLDSRITKDEQGSLVFPPQPDPFEI